MGRFNNCALVGHYKIKLNKQSYRLVYGVKDDGWTSGTSVTSSSL